MYHNLSTPSGHAPLLQKESLFSINYSLSVLSGSGIISVAIHQVELVGYAVSVEYRGIFFIYKNYRDYVPALLLNPVFVMNESIPSLNITQSFRLYYAAQYSKDGAHQAEIAWLMLVSGVFYYNDTTHAYFESMKSDGAMFTTVSNASSIVYPECPSCPPCDPCDPCNNGPQEIGVGAWVPVGLSIIAGIFASVAIFKKKKVTC